MALLIGGLIIVFMPQIMVLLSQLSEETQSVAQQVYFILAIGAGIKILNMTLAMGALRAGGDNRYCLITDTVAMWLISLPLTFVAAFYWQWPMPYVVLMAFSEEICKAIMFGYRVYSKRWMNNLT